MRDPDPIVHDIKVTGVCVGTGAPVRLTFIALAIALCGRFAKLASR